MRVTQLTVAGPMIVTPLCLAFLIKTFVLFSGIPSAIIAIVRNWEIERERYIVYFITELQVSQRHSLHPDEGPPLLHHKLI